MISPLQYLDLSFILIGQKTKAKQKVREFSFLSATCSAHHVPHSWPTLGSITGQAGVHLLPLLCPLHLCLPVSSTGQCSPLSYIPYLSSFEVLAFPIPFLLMLTMLLTGFYHDHMFFSPAFVTSPSNLMLVRELAPCEATLSGVGMKRSLLLSIK